MTALRGLLIALALAGCGRWGYGDESGDVTGGPVTGVDAAAGGDGAPDAEAPSLAYCERVPALPAAPVIDGALDDGAALAALLPVGWLGAGAGVPAGQSARYAVAWRPDGLYVFVEVVDPDRVVGDELAWCGDAVEVFVDADGSYGRAPAYDDPGARQLILAAPAAGSSSERRGEAWCTGCAGSYPLAVDGARFVAVPTATGYAVEVMVTAADIGLAAWSPAGRVGFDLAIDVSTDAPTGLPCQVDGAYGSRLGQYFLRISDAQPLYPFATAAAFCTSELVGGS